MKRVFVILCALITLASCSKEVLPGTDPVQNTDPVVAQSTEIPVNVTVTLGDLVPESKATIKKGWADGDVIFLFFRGVAAPKYAKLIYDAADKTWMGYLENELTPMEIAALTEKVLTAVYMPFGSTAKVAADGTDFTFVDDERNPFNYTGYFFLNDAVEYSLGKNLDINNLNLPAFVPVTAGDALIHFDISGFTSGNLFTFKQAHIKPLSVTGVSAAGSVQTTEGAKGGLINGYEYQSMVSFSGILDASAVGNEVEYGFTIDDTTADVIYFLNVGNKNIPGAQYIGIGDITASRWTATPYVEMGDGLKWAKSNLGAASETAAGNFYAWGETATKNNFTWSTYKHMRQGYSAATYISKYSFKDNQRNALWYTYKYPSGYTFVGDYPAQDGVEHKDLASHGYVDDPARQALQGEWRTPTAEEWAALCNTANFTWTWGNNGATVTSKVEGYKGNQIFLPAAGYKDGGNVMNGSGNQRRGYYWSSTLGGNSTLGSRIQFSKQNGIGTTVRFGETTKDRYYGYLIRAVIEQ